MRKFYFLFALCIGMMSCKNDAKSNTNTNENEGKVEIHSDSNITTTKTVGKVDDTFSGMFLYLESDNAAVLQTAGSNMYGVVVDEKMKELNEKCKQYKVNDHDMVPVVVRGVKKPNPVKNAWKEVVEITEILSVQKPSGQDGTIIIRNNQ